MNKRGEGRGSSLQRVIEGENENDDAVHYDQAMSETLPVEGLHVDRATVLSRTHYRLAYSLGCGAIRWLRLVQSASDYDLWTFVFS